MRRNSAPFAHKLIISFVVISGLILMLGCPSMLRTTVEHRNVSIDLSPDGKTLVFSSADGDLFLLDMGQLAVTRLTDTDRIESYPSFSPDGKQIVFASHEGGTSPSRIDVLTLEDHTVRTVTDSKDHSDMLPRFTPDGSQIVFARAYEHRPYSMGGWKWDDWDVCRVHGDGGDVQRLTEQAYYQLYRIVPRTSDQFVYAADSLGLNTPAALYEVSTEGQPSQLIPRPGKSNTDVNAWASDPMLAPDGTTLTFCSDRTKPFFYDVCVKPADGPAKGLVGTKSRYNRLPDFFPDGKRIVFLAGTQFNAGNRALYSLWEVTLSGQTREIASSDLFTRPTIWSPPKPAEPTDTTDSP